MALNARDEAMLSIEPGYIAIWKLSARASRHAAL